MKNKTRVGIFYGGNSCEHDVSCMTADSILKHIDRNKFEVIEVPVDRDGNFDHKILLKIDVAFLAFHGENYEDGKFQEFLDMRAVKYTGSGAKSSEINMDKVLQKQYFVEAGLKIVDYLTTSAKNSLDEIIKDVKETIGLPCFMKPISTGSSLSISKVSDYKEFAKAIAEAKKINNSIIIEAAVVKPRELEVGVLGNDDLIISDPGEVLSNGEFYSYETKYFKPFATTTNAKNLSKEMIEKIKDWAGKAYKATDCRGYARIDFFLDQKGELYINEINSLPGFTNISMYPKLMESAGIKYDDLITRIIELALEK